MTTHENTSASIRRFPDDIAQADVDDLMSRLSRTRLPQPSPGDDWVYGVPNSWLRDAIDQWTTSFDWRAQEARMNEFPHHLTEIDGRTVHFIPSRRRRPTPLRCCSSTHTRGRSSTSST